MIYVLLLAVLILAALLARLVLALKRMQKRHELAIRELDARWAAKLQEVESSLSRKADVKTLGHLAAMVDGVAVTGVRIEGRLAALEGSDASPAGGAQEPDL